MGSRFDLQLGMAEETSPRSSPVTAPGLPLIASIHADGNASFAIARDGTLYGWGNAQPGLYGWGNAQPGLYAGSPRRMVFPAPLRTAAIGGGTILGIATADTAWHSGNLWTSGGMVSYRDPSRLVLGDATRKAKALSLSAGNALIVDTEGGIRGLDTFSAAAAPVTHEVPAPMPGLPPVQQVVSLGAAAVALDNSGTLWAWGIDPSASLWDNSSATQYTAPKPILAGKTATSIHGGDGHFCAVLSDGSAQCHGNRLGRQSLSLACGDQGDRVEWG